MSERKTKGRCHVVMIGTNLEALIAKLIRLKESVIAGGGTLTEMYIPDHRTQDIWVFSEDLETDAELAKREAWEQECARRNKIRDDAMNLNQLTTLAENLGYDITKKDS